MCVSQFFTIITSTSTSTNWNDFFPANHRTSPTHITKEFRTRGRENKNCAFFVSCDLWPFIRYDTIQKRCPLAIESVRVIFLWFQLENLNWVCVRKSVHLTRLKWLFKANYNIKRRKSTQNERVKKKKESIWIKKERKRKSVRKSERDKKKCVICVK